MAYSNVHIVMDSETVIDLTLDSDFVFVLLEYRAKPLTLDEITGDYVEFKYDELPEVFKIAYAEFLVEGYR